MKTLCLAAQKKREQDKKVTIQVNLTYEMTASEWDDVREHIVSCHESKMILIPYNEEEFAWNLDQAGINKVAVKCKIK